MAVVFRILLNIYGFLLVFLSSMFTRNRAFCQSEHCFPTGLSADTFLQHNLGEDSMILNEYLALFTGATREKPRFMALAEAVLRQVMDLQAVIGQTQAAFSVEGAEGVQLDALAGALGIRRSELGENVPDSAFRQYIRGKLALRRWDGTNGTAQAALEEALPGRTETDNQDGTVTVSPDGERWKGIVAVPAGVTINE